ncbi:MAG: NUDIX hydrolase [Acidimicrobiales bacterium]
MRAVRAAGGVVTQVTDNGTLEVLLVHRPGYRDWTFPKGKADEGERWRDTALREVEEETGYHCRLHAKLPSISYLDRKGRDKEVRYWVMTVISGTFAANDEVDKVEWLSVDDARKRLSYKRDHLLLEALPTLAPA